MPVRDSPWSTGGEARAGHVYQGTVKQVDRFHGLPCARHLQEVAEEFARVLAVMVVVGLAT